MSVKSVAVVALLSAAALAYPTGRIQRRNEVASSDDVSSIGMRSDNDLYDTQDVFARGDKNAEYIRKVNEYTSLYNQWKAAFEDANRAMLQASHTITAQESLKMANSPHYSAAAHSQAHAEFTRQQKAMGTAKKNLDNYHIKLASLKPPKARRSLDVEDVEDFELRSTDDSYDTLDVFARGDKNAEYARKVQDYTSLYNQWKHAFDDANHAMIKASNTITAQESLKMANSPHYNAGTHSQAHAEFTRQQKLMGTAKKNADSYHSKLIALKPPKARRSLDFESLEELD
ncbi:hypothetical protein CALVIDRAFT_557530 [Calocera viscosa TUFC12733]|uniref:Uncharacterized protein n=1 Tax=Calocera viscosa (strain TUFC12733) TaxID=1330018 RepID=A0A167I9Y4_CALVF|nr:hypothetical protein CALVIDRAFT_557530 [Calocera viscosa TUFC12733]